MIESEQSTRIRLIANEDRLFWQRFEDSVQRGIPDGFIGVGRTSHAWVELKRTAGPEKPVYRPGQLAFALNAGRLGQRCATLASGDDALIRVYDTSAMAEAAAFDRDWPPPYLCVYDLREALYAAAGCRINFGSGSYDAKTA